ncbi:hypothetical protein GGR50DRAFT_694380 [Xylaria sp. CBS 124048]|nr:hypothetical protein GGR50DRAFT_694380 [Xylaria sp. CBS 124048]
MAPHRLDLPKAELNSRRIFLINSTKSITPSAVGHFYTGRLRRICKKPCSLESFGVWTKKSDAKVRDWAAEYKEMRALGLGEEEVTMLSNLLFSRDVSGPKMANRAYASAFVLLQRHPAVPDCAYWLSLKGFSPEYRFVMENHVFVRNYITCPYFTIDFKREGQSLDVAVSGLRLLVYWRSPIGGTYTQKRRSAAKGSWRETARP